MFYFYLLSKIFLTTHRKWKPTEKIICKFSLNTRLLFSKIELYLKIYFHFSSNPTGVRKNGGFEQYTFKIKDYTRNDYNKNKKSLKNHLINKPSCFVY